MKQYLETLNNILVQGVDRVDRTGTGTRSLFAQQMRFNLTDGFPAVTTKKLAWKAVVSELLWFLEGSCDERRLAELLYNQSRDQLQDKKTIWTANAQHWQKNAKFEGDLGRIYGQQWRSWDSSHSVDQIAQVIERIKNKPWDRRHIVTAWNPSDLDQQALPPCHILFQFYVVENNLSCHIYMRSCDYPLGCPFNIASYALLTHMIAQVCNLKAYELIMTTGDSHIYLNQFEGVSQQLERIPGELPTLWLNPEILEIDHFTMDDIKLLNYNPQSEIKFPFSV